MCAAGFEAGLAECCEGFLKPGCVEFREHIALGNEGSLRSDFDQPAVGVRVRSGYVDCRLGLKNPILNEFKRDVRIAGSCEAEGGGRA